MAVVLLSTSDTIPDNRWYHRPEKRLKTTHDAFQLSLPHPPRSLLCRSVAPSTRMEKEERQKAGWVITPLVQPPLAPVLEFLPSERLLS
ncbi:hypothetical protein B296_00057044 [Ensete ventricosum]|uniref:Uncharacterized protein n=1 Tax=Ensete ventricosum TaxID=4639 RepID=A0A426XST5_ENSVE|nr:hypothetical protein B296_00057044 [Ensete ventricosum]